MLHAMIMAGGGGTRFWPRSRQQRPKQFLTLTGDRSLLQMALDRIEAQVPAERTWVLTAEAHRAEAAHQLAPLPPHRVVGEPCGRDTAACIALGAALIAQRDPSAVMVVTPADHLIEPVQEFRRALHVAEQIAEENPKALITFGIPPTYPSTGYGYIHRGDELTTRQGVSVFRVKVAMGHKSGFREKPDAELAEQFLNSGEYFWNAGIFVWKVSAILDQLRLHRPQTHAAVLRIAEAWETPQRDTVFQQEYSDLEKISIDYAVMENADEVLVVKAPYRWDDVGSWLALERLHPQDASGNTILARHVGLHTHSCVIVGEANRLIATIGVDNLLIIQDGNATLVADRREEGTVKNIVETLRKQKLEEYL